MDATDGFTGLEAAIVLIAFVVVASVFSFAVLGGGFFATEKAREVTMEAKKTATAVTVLGTVVARTHSNYEKLHWIEFSCEVIGEPVRASDIRFSLITTDRIYTIPSSAVTLTWNLKEHGGDLLTRGDILNVRLDISNAALGAGSSFTLAIHPPTGLPTNHQCRVPPSVIKNRIYEVG